MIESHNLENVYCKLEMKSGFRLYGYPRMINDDGVFFETDQKSSFINWNMITVLIPVNGEGF